MRRFWRGLMMAVVCFGVVSPASAATVTKFGAWSSRWFDAPNPLFYGTLDGRNERVYVNNCVKEFDPAQPPGPNNAAACASWGLFPAVALFAETHKGYLYTLGDEPDASR